MNIASIDIFRYTLPLSRPLKAGSTSFDTRSGYIVRVADDAGHVGLGDVAPLPGVSRESFEQALEATINLCRGVWLGDAAHLDAIVRSFEETPSAPTGFFMAQDMLLAQIDGVTLAEHLGGQSRDAVSVNALLDWDEGTADAELQRVHDAGYGTVKLKVGRAAIDEDVRRVHAVRDALGGDITLRLDANQSWDMDAALRFATGVRDCAIEYIEEPLQDPAHIGDFAGDTGLAVALDESVAYHIHRIGTLQRTQGVSAVVLKPTLVGGLANVVEFAREAHLLGITPVVSACYESGVGIAGLAHLAAALTVEDVPAGLDTYHLLREDVLGERLELVEGRLRLAQIDRALASFDSSSLERVFHV
jgi:o-succinylbenzoate synthase